MAKFEAINVQYDPIGGLQSGLNFNPWHTGTLKIK